MIFHQEIQLNVNFAFHHSGAMSVKITRLVSAVQPLSVTLWTRLPKFVSIVLMAVLLALDKQQHALNATLTILCRMMEHVYVMMEHIYNLVWTLGNVCPAMISV